MVLSTSSSAPLVAVVGATGLQGGSVITHLIASDKPYRIRALTRDTTKEKAKALEAKGCEVVQADIGQKEDLVVAFKGANIVFGITSSFFQHFQASIEIQEGKNIVDAAKEVGCDLLVWSGVESPLEVSSGKFTKVVHFDLKLTVTKYARAQGVPLVVVQPGSYADNFTGRTGPTKSDGTFVLALPMKASTRIPIIFTERDYGAYVREAIESSGFGPGSEVLASSEEITPTEVASLMSEASGTEIKYQEMTDEEYIKSKPYGGAELAEMFRYFEEFGYYAGKDIAASQVDLAVPVHSFADYLKTVNWSECLA